MCKRITNHWTSVLEGIPYRLITKGDLSTIIFYSGNCFHEIKIKDRSAQYEIISSLAYNSEIHTDLDKRFEIWLELACFLNTIVPIGNYLVDEIFENNQKIGIKFVYKIQQKILNSHDSLNTVRLIEMTQRDYQDFFQSIAELIQACTENFTPIEKFILGVIKGRGNF